MDESPLLNTFIAVVVSIGLIYLTLFLWNIVSYLKKGRNIVLAQIIGAVLTLLGIWAFGIVSYAEEGSNIVYSLMVLAGIFMIMISLLKLISFKFDKLLILQISLIILSLIPYAFIHVPWSFIPRTFIIAAVLFLIRSPLSLICKSSFGKMLVNLASWLWVAFSWLRYYLIQAPSTCTSHVLLLIPITSLLIWDFSVVITYENSRRWL